MKTQVNKVLMFGFSWMLSLAAVAGLRCHLCWRVNAANICTDQLQRQCLSDGFCYTQRFSKGGVIRRVSRGCSPTCKQMVDLRKNLKVSAFCCEEDFCNVYNAWT